MHLLSESGSHLSYHRSSQKNFRRPQVAKEEAVEGVLELEKMLVLGRLLLAWQQPWQPSSQESAAAHILLVSRVPAPVELVEVVEVVEVVGLAPTSSPPAPG